MTGKRYYITTLDAWQRHAHRFAQSHYIALDILSDPQVRLAVDLGAHLSLDPATKILVLVEADEGAHLALEDDSAFEALPHPFTQTPISAAAHAALSVRLMSATTPQASAAPGETRSALASNATTFDAAEAAARVHPLLRLRVF
jgi:hypothetical protein